MVAEKLNTLLAGKTVYSDAWGQDFAWSALFEEAEMHMEFKIEALSGLPDRHAKSGLARYAGTRPADAGTATAPCQRRRQGHSDDPSTGRKTLRSVAALTPPWERPDDLA